MSKTIFEKSQAGQHAYSLPKDCPEFLAYSPPQELLRKGPLKLPELSELDLSRHFAELASRNVGIDNRFYPLGSCTMKLNPRVNEWAAALPRFTRTHPLAPDETVQGNLEVVAELTRILCELSGMSAGTLVPCAGAQGEFTGLSMIREYHTKRGESRRTEILIPDDAHGTNPASATMAGLTTIPIKTDVTGDLDIDDLRSKVSDRTAGLMMTNPNTLGLFSQSIEQIAQVVHGHGGLLYYDGANMNAIMGIVKPGVMGFDVMHLNLHKTFSTPHGGGGPGSGPVLCNDLLAPLLPLPRVIKERDLYRVEWDSATSIGAIAAFHGNFAVYLRAYLYARLHGFYGLRRVSENAVLNANYLKQLVGQYFTIPYPQPCMHEFVVRADAYLDQGVRALDIAKRLLDYGFYAPTVYFPLIVKESLLIEPTETESKATLDAFVDALSKIIDEIREDPEMVKKAPYDQPVSRLDEVEAARHPILTAL